MLKTIFYSTMLFVALSCNNSPSAPQSTKNDTLVSASTDSIAYSFAFLGCNREGHASNPSTADTAILNAIMADILSQQRQPDALFFLGDLVLGETDTATLDRQLSHWVPLIKSYRLPASMELVALPGNHEMLKNLHYKETPLYGTTSVWMRHMGRFMPLDREKVTPDPEGYNQMTFAFSRKGIGFIAMNTDTYNETPGKEGMINKAWVESKIQSYCDSFSLVFVLSHKPAFSYGQFQTGHSGFPDSKSIMNVMNAGHAVALLSAHVHDYQRWQPLGSGPYQIIAGNGGSPLDGSALNPYFGYSIINVLKSGRVALRTRGLASGTFTDKDVTYLR